MGLLSYSGRGVLMCNGDKCVCMWAFVAVWYRERLWWGLFLLLCIEKLLISSCTP